MPKTYIQIGANIGNDDFQRMMEGLTEQSLVVLIEPNISLLQLLSTNYEELRKKHQIVILPYAIALTNGVEKFYKSTNSQLSSMLNRQSDIGYGDKSQKDVEAKTFNTLCNMLNVVDVELLFIDTEGLDYEILNSIDLEKVNIKTIYFEVWPHESDDLNNKYRSGPKFLNEVILPKFKNYKSESLSLSGMLNYKFTLNI